MDELGIECECEDSICKQISQKIRELLGIRVEVKPVTQDSLPRWEAKAKRFVDLRTSLQP